MSDSQIPAKGELAEPLETSQVPVQQRTQAPAPEGAPPAGPPAPERSVAATVLREIFSATLIVNGGYDAHSANAAIARGEADLVAFGVPFLANPDLPARYRQSAPLNAPDYATFYSGEEKGYVDYPTLA